VTEIDDACEWLIAFVSALGDDVVDADLGRRARPLRYVDLDSDRDPGSPCERSDRWAEAAA
jgi:hypothetical protein